LSSVDAKLGVEERGVLVDVRGGDDGGGLPEGDGERLVLVLVGWDIVAGTWLVCKIWRKMRERERERAIYGVKYLMRWRGGWRDVKEGGEDF
jgi:hypothetical protein